MPHTPESRARAYEKMKMHRARWFDENGPCKKCGSSKNMEVDHIYADDKVSHCVWSWTPARRALELAKCQVLCRKCHRQKTSASGARSTGRIVPSLRKITDKQVLKAVLLRQMGMPVRKIGSKFKVSHVTIIRLTNAAMGDRDFRHRGNLLGS